MDVAADVFGQHDASVSRSWTSIRAEKQSNYEEERAGSFTWDYDYKNIEQGKYKSNRTENLDHQKTRNRYIKKFHNVEKLETWKGTIQTSFFTVQI